MAQTNPESKPLPFSQCNLKFTLFINFPSRVRTDTASDCVPEFPDIPLIIGINAANNATCDNVASKLPKIVAVIMPKM